MPLDTITTLLTVIALALAIWQTRSAFAQAKDLKAQAGHLETIQSSLSTKYLGQFPDFVPTIVDILSSAKNEIVIVCDFPCYCLFSDHFQWLDYEAVLKRKIAAEIEVDLTVLGSQQRYQLARHQFRVGDDQSDDWRQPKEIAQLLVEFLQRRAPSKAKEDISFAEFCDLVEETHLAALEYSFKGIVPREINTSMPLYFWIVDSTRAVFSIPSFVAHDREQGFLTFDTKLIAALHAIVDRIKSNKS